MSISENEADCFKINENPLINNSYIGKNFKLSSDIIFDNPKKNSNNYNSNQNYNKSNNKMFNGNFIDEIFCFSPTKNEEKFKVNNNNTLGFDNILNRDFSMNMNGSFNFPFPRNIMNGDLNILDSSENFNFKKINKNDHNEISFNEELFYKDSFSDFKRNNLPNFSNNGNNINAFTNSINNKERYDNENRKNNSSMDELKMLNAKLQEKTPEDNEIDNNFFEGNALKISKNTNGNLLKK